jgi:hypothetical protein
MLGAWEMGKKVEKLEGCQVMSKMREWQAYIVFGGSTV